MERHDAILRRISSSPSRRELWKALLEEMAKFGVKMASYHTAGNDGRPMPIATDGYPESWVCKYIDEDLVHIDPMPALAAKLARPFYWHEIEELAPSTADTRRYLKLLKASHIGDGLALYVFGPGLQNAYVGLGFGEENISLDPLTLLQIHSIAQTGHLRFCELQVAGAPRPKLSPRETEILEWVARGKSNSVIADILSVSQHTVDTHMRRIYSKLDVSDRTSAALRGVGSAMVQMG